jgi:hypothetical protein
MNNRDDYDYPNPGPLYGNPRYPGNGRMPPHPDDRNDLTAWARLARGCALGKKSVLIYDDERVNAAVPMLQIEGQDGDAQNIVVTLGSPSVIALPLVDFAGLNLQAITGEQTNFQSGARTFPGTASPTEWPAIMAVLEWGVGGVSSKAYVDFVNGTTINLTASWLRVHAAISEFDADAVPGTSAAYVLQAFVGPGFTRNGTAHRTIYVGELPDNTESAVFPVPPFANRARLISTNGQAVPSATAGAIRFYRSAAGLASGDGIADCLVSATDVERAFDVPNGAEFFSVFNSQGESDVLFGVVFELAI